MSIDPQAAAPAVAQGNPFPGLRAFAPEDDHLFFGRAAQVDELLKRLRRRRFLAVVGAPGSGKSSLVCSGLVSSLYSGYMTEAGSSWRVAPLRPGVEPIASLAVALNQPEVLGQAVDDADMSRSLTEVTLYRSSRGLVEAVRQARLPKDDRLLVLVDPFEELLRFKLSPRHRGARKEVFDFVKLLVTATTQDEVPVYVVITLRSDFLLHGAELPGLAEAINEGQFLVPQLTRDELRQAIEGPIKVCGAEIAPRLVTRLLNDFSEAGDPLPALQHALRRLWEVWAARHQDGEPLDLGHYEAIGTLKQALHLHVEEVWHELGDEHPKELCERLFKTLADASSDPQSCRPTSFREVCEIAGASPEEMTPVVEAFRRPDRAFLTPPPPVPLIAGTVLDLAHESLTRLWRRLARWTEEEKAAAETYRGLVQAAARHRSGRGGLYRDPELQVALNWRRRTRPTPAWGELYAPDFAAAMRFLDQSEAERDAETTALERHRKKRLGFAYGAITLLLILLLIVVFLIR